MRSDILIIGGGIVGSAIAYFLSKSGTAGSVTVVEPDPTYEFAATPYANGGIRQLFSLPENISMAQYGLQFFQDFSVNMSVDDLDADIGFRRRGYLFLSDDGDHATMEKNFRLQSAMGARVDLLDKSSLKDRFPSINADDIDLAVHSPDDAWINPHAALMGLRAKSKELGATYVQDRVVDWQAAGAVSRQVHLASGQQLSADVFVLSTGAWSAEIARMIGLVLPVEPMCRESHYFTTPAEIEPLPFLKTETHLAFGPEGQGYAGGLPDWQQPAGFGLQPHPTRFEEIVWPAIAHRVPALETLRLERSWIGHYARNTLDLNAIIGRWRNGNVYLACGYSGHGIMQAPATGLALSEAILGGRYETIDLTKLGVERIEANTPYREKGIV
ncbi:MAG: FAD-binding oxidoreductase [Pseudomonadota bacterium]